MGRQVRTVKAYYHLVFGQGKKFSRVRLIALGSGSDKRTQDYAMQGRGTVMPFKAIYSVMNPDSVEELGPGFIVVVHKPKYNLVADAGFYFAELQ